MSQGRKRNNAQLVREGFLRILIEDVIAATSRKLAKDSQSNRRDLARTTFAAIEGTIWDYRTALTKSALDLEILTPDEESALAESVVQVGANGKLSKQTRFIPVLSAFRLLTRIARRIDPAIAVDFGSSEWHGLQTAFAIRNRITHPKSIDDLIVSQADLDTMAFALHWLLETHLAVLTATHAALVSFISEAREVSAALLAGDPKAIAEYEAARTAIELTG